MYVRIYCIFQCIDARVRMYARIYCILPVYYCMGMNVCENLLYFASVLMHGYECMREFIVFCQCIDARV